jgi:peptidoglycan-associated lipoprotein
MSLASLSHVERPRNARELARALNQKLARRGTCLFGLVCVCMVAACGPDYPKCDTDEDCQKGEFCINNLCQQCRNNADCPAGQRCASGACEAIPGYCNSSADCGPGKVCENNTCVGARKPPPPAAAPTTVSSGCELGPAYFDYDSSTLSDSARDQLSRNASCMRERSARGVHLTGLTDPRGTEEYNLALGERRAQSAQQYMKSLGADGDVSYSSMGEELASGTEESGWSRDRRVDFKFK